MYSLPEGDFTKEHYEKAIAHAIAIELTTIPCYLSTYYSIIRTPKGSADATGQDVLYNKILAHVKDPIKAQELTMDVILYSNKSAGIIMSVVVEEMLHMSLSSNVHQASVGAPDIMAAGKALTYPATLVPDVKEFKINRAPLSIDTLITFLEIESPNSFQPDPTIGQYYDKLMQYVCDKDINWRLPSAGFPQLVPSQPYYAQNTVNTIYFDKDHKPKFPSDNDSGGMIEVFDAGSAINAMKEIIHQGEGNNDGSKLEFVNGRPKPLPIVDGKVQFKDGDYDDIDKKELSHFAKFMELYTWGLHYEAKFKAHPGLDDFFSYFVYNQDTNPYTTDYPTGSDSILLAKSQLANAIYTYILLMIETCYYKELPTQYEVFMMGIHKSMIWLLSQFGNDMNQASYTKNGQTFVGAVTFEFYTFDSNPAKGPKAQMIVLAKNLIKATTNPETGKSTYDWLFTSPEYLLALPDVSLDHKVNSIPLTSPKF